MDRNELLNDQEAGLRLMLDGRQSRIWTAMPGIITKVDLTKMVCNVQLSLQGRIEKEDGSLEYVNLPELGEVPIVFQSGGGFAFTFPVAAGDEALVVFSSRCIDSWWQSGGYANKPMEARMHDLSDGFAVVGPKSLPNVLASISASEAQFRNEAGTTYLSITNTGKIGFANATTDLKTVLTDLQSTLNAFMTTLSGFGGGGAPVTQTMLQTPAATAVTQLTAILVKIGALLK